MRFGWRQLCSVVVSSGLMLAFVPAVSAVASPEAVSSTEAAPSPVVADTATATSRADVSSAGAKVIRPVKKGRSFSATVTWDQKLSKGRARGSVRLVAINNGIPVLLASQKKGKSLKQNVRFVLAPKQLAVAKKASRVVIAASQQWGRKGSVYFTKNYVAVGTVKPSARATATQTRACGHVLLRADADAAGCDLIGGYLVRAYLPGINLAGSNLSGTQAQRAILTRADLSNTEVAGLAITGARLTKANVSDSVGKPIGKPLSGPTPGSNPSPPPPPVTVPGVPASPTPVAGDQAVDLSWNAPAANGGSPITGYNVQVSTNDSTGFADATGCADLGAVLTCTTSGLTNGTTYYFRVAARNAQGLGGYSAASAAATPSAVPSAPSAPTSSAHGDGTVTLNWSAPSDAGGLAITGYNVQVSTSDNSGFADVAGCTDLGDVATCVASGLTNGTPYYFRVAAKNDNGLGAYSPASASFTPSTVPVAPSAPTSSGQGDGTVTLNWGTPSSNGGSDVTGYNVQVSTNDTTGFADATACTNLGNVLTCTASGLTNGTPYYFKVAAENANGLGAYSAVSASFTPTTTPTAPAAPTSSVQGNGTVTLNWLAPSSTGGSDITGYNVQFSTNDTTGFADATACTNLGVVLTCTASGLTNGTPYYFKLAAKNSNGLGAYSPASAAFTPSTTPGAPDAPTSSGHGDGTVTLNWTAPSSTGGSDITGYNVQVSTNDTTGFADATGCTNLGVVLTCTASGLTNGTEYFFIVAAKNGNGLGVYSTASAGFTPSTTPGAPDAPTSSGHGDGTVTLNWTAPSSTGGSDVTGYNVQVSTNDTTGFADATACTNLGVVLTCTASGLTNGTPYFFKLAAKNANGLGAYSSASAAFTPSTTPGAPDAPTSSAQGNGTVTLNWTAPASTGGSDITGYNVQFSTNDATGFADATACTNLGVVLTCTATGLTNGTPYFFKVAAKNGNGLGAYSAVSAAFTPSTTPGAPDAPTSSVHGNGTVTLNWTAPSNTGGSDVIGYNVQVSTDSTTGFADATDCTNLGNVLTCTASGLTNGTEYYFIVAAKNGNGLGAYSPASAAFTPSTTPGAPDAPTSSAYGDGTVTLNWTAPTNTGGEDITGYNVQVSTNDTTGFADATDCTNLGNVLTCTASGLTNGTEYFFKVAAENGNGLGAYSAASAAFTPSTTPGTPDAPTSSAQGNGTVTLNWTAPSDGGADIEGYNVQVSTDSTTGFADATDCTNLGNVLTCTASGLTNGTEYFFKVAAENDNGEGAYSAASAGFTPATTPSAPDAPTSSAQADGSVTLDWTAPSSTGGATITGYSVQSATTSTGPWSDTNCATNTTTTTCTVTGLTTGDLYYFQVAATNGKGTGTYSGPGGPFKAAAPCAEGGECEVGDTGPGGGTVFYVADSPQLWGSYLEAAPSGWSGTATDPVPNWCSNVSGLLSGTFGTQIGTGKSNTDLMIASGACTNGAGVAARAYTGGGLTDWSLPSQEELNQLYLNKDVVDGLGIEVSGETYALYYSSSQVDNDDAWGQNLGTGEQISFAKWNLVGTLLTRPTRAFGPVTSCEDGGPCAIGDTGPGGGTVFYDAGSNQSWGRYLEAAPTGWPGGGEDYPTDQFATGACIDRSISTSTDIGTGATNTATVRSQCSNGSLSPAAQRAATYQGGGLSDWYLPSRDEMGELLDQTQLFEEGEYLSFWTSSASTSGGEGMAYLGEIDLTQSPPAVYSYEDYRDNEGKVLPIRAFAPAGALSTPGSPSSVAFADQTVTLDWTAPADNGASPITGYNVQVSTNSTTGFVDATGCTNLGVVLTCTATGLTNGTPYYFKVAARNANGQGPYSAASAAFTPSTTPGIPDAPTSLAQGDGTVTLNWTAPANTGGADITGYNVQVSTESEAGFADAANCTNLGDVLTCTASGLTNGTEYFFVVAAENANGLGGYSSAGGPFEPLAPTCAEGGDCQLGDVGPGGGTVFYVAETPQTWGSYLEAAPAGWSGAANDPTPDWCDPVNEWIDNVGGIGLGRGVTNTDWMVVDGACASGAGVMARAYTGGGLDDWSLPSQEELNQLYLHQDLIDGLGMDVSGTEYKRYYTSDQWDVGTAMMQDLITGDQIEVSKANTEQTIQTRPTRSFGPTAPCAQGGPCQIGDIGPGGGTVFYDAGSNQMWGRYLEAAPLNWDNGTEPGDYFATSTCVGKPFSTGTGIGTGATNTSTILNQCSNGSLSPAARVAASYVGGGLQGWHLPSKDELSALLENLSAEFPAGSFYNYWSSSTFMSSGDAVAWMQEIDIEDGSPEVLEPYDQYRSYGGFIRPVRAF